MYDLTIEDTERVIIDYCNEVFRPNGASSKKVDRIHLKNIAKLFEERKQHKEQIREIETDLKLKNKLIEDGMKMMIEERQKEINAISELWREAPSGNVKKKRKIEEIDN